MCVYIYIYNHNYNYNYNYNYTHIIITHILIHILILCMYAGDHGYSKLRTTSKTNNSFKRKHEQETRSERQANFTGMR